MSRATAVSVTSRRKTGRAGAVAARAWGWGSVGALLITLSLVHVGEGRPGDLDPTFGMRGQVTTAFGLIDFAQALVLQPDGTLVAAGLSIQGAASFVRLMWLASPSRCMGGFGCSLADAVVQRTA
jgi:hypothetical protein